MEEKELESIDECIQYRERPGITWLNIDGLHDIETINRIGQQFNIHPLVLEDILNTEQRPKLDDLEDYLFIVAKMFYLDLMMTKSYLSRSALSSGTILCFHFRKMSVMFFILSGKDSEKTGAVYGKWARLFVVHTIGLTC